MLPPLYRDSLLYPGLRLHMCAGALQSGICCQEMRAESQEGQSPAWFLERSGQGRWPSGDLQTAPWASCLPRWLLCRPAVQVEARMREKHLIRIILKQGIFANDFHLQYLTEGVIVLKDEPDVWYKLCRALVTRALLSLQSLFHSGKLHGSFYSQPVISTHLQYLERER